MKAPLWTVPLAVVLIAAAGLGVAELFAIPTVEIEFAARADAAEPALVRLNVPAVRCADTARSAGGTLEDADGVLRYVAYASHNRVEITYDAAVTDPEALIEAIEGPVYDEASGEFRFGVFVATIIEEP